MPPEFRYSLTRICLRTGQLSLSPRMAAAFPESGAVRALDTLDDREYDLRVSEPRKVSGLRAFLERHRLEVNDEIRIRLREDGQVTLTAVPRTTRRSFEESDLRELLDSLVDEAPRTEAEIRALYPQIPAAYPLAESLAAHPRLHLRGGRWIVQPEGVEAAAPAGAAESPEQAGAGNPTAAADVSSTGSADAPSPADALSIEADVDEGNHFVTGSGAEASAAPVAPADADEPTGPAPTDGVPTQASDAATGRAPVQRSGGGRDRSRRDRERGHPGRPAAVTPYPRGVLFPGEAALNSQRPAGDLRLVNRAREALTGFGYRVEGLPHGMLLARADLGRRQHTVLVRVLADGERLDWAALLARRRELSADYLAVFGDHRDLHRLTAPADLARATLWSWDGIARIRNLAQTVLIGPFDLEPHFGKDGMFENGLRKFERSLGRMIAEKGALSAVISRLGSLRAPAVFVLDDLVEGDLQREQVANALELLAQAPFHLVARVDRGEYCLRHSVAESLAHLSEYARSLGARLPAAARKGAVLPVDAPGAASGGDREGEAVPSGRSPASLELTEDA